MTIQIMFLNKLCHSTGIAEFGVLSVSHIFADNQLPLKLKIKFNEDIYKHTEPYTVSTLTPTFCRVLNLFFRIRAICQVDNHPVLFSQVVF